MTTVIIVLLAVNLLVGIVATLVALSAKKGSGVSKREAEAIVKGESDYQTRALQSTMTAANGTLLSALKVHTETQGASTDRFMNRSPRISKGRTSASRSLSRTSKVVSRR